MCSGNSHGTSPPSNSTMAACTLLFLLHTGWHTPGEQTVVSYLKKSIALDIIAFMHESASVASNGFPQILHGTAGRLHTAVSSGATA